MEKKKLVFATNNPHKLEEIQAIVGDTFDVVGLKAIGCHDEIPEEEPTLEGNALAKARFVTSRYGFDCFADDTGLEVDALGGSPGVRSARFAGEPANAENNTRLLLQKLEGEKNRSARFRTAIALILDGREYLFEGKVHGSIIRQKTGKKGFGYDPVFIPEGFDETFAEMASETKNSISHRGRAMRKLIAFLKQHR